LKRRPRLNNRRAAAQYRAAASTLKHPEITMNRILEVTDEDDTLILEYVDLDDLKNEGILSRNLFIEPRGQQ
jgi:hypothetical protein